MTGKIMPLFQSSLQKAEQWVEDVMTELQYEDPSIAYSTLRAVLHTLRDRLTPGEAADLAASMPVLLRGFYFEGWRPAAENRPERYRHKEEFLQHVSNSYNRLQDDDAEKAVVGVFRVLTRHIPEGELEDVKSQLPEDVRALWPN